MKSYSDLKEDLEQRRKELQAKQKKQIEDRKKQAISYRDIVAGNMEKEKKKQEKLRQKEAERKQALRAREAMKKETELFFSALIREDRSVLQFIDSDFTYLNENLAKHYRIEGVKGSQFQRVTLPKSSSRGGILTHASILTITSNPTRTSPVLRGKWILEQQRNYERSEIISGGDNIISATGFPGHWPINGSWKFSKDGNKCTIDHKITNTEKMEWKC